MTVGIVEGDYACVWSGELGRLELFGKDFYSGPGGTHSCTRVMVNCSIENVETVTDNAEYRTGSVSAREGWQTCPGVLSIRASLRIRIQVMTSFDRKTTRGASKRRAWEAGVLTTTLPAHRVL